MRLVAGFEEMGHIYRIFTGKILTKTFIQNWRKFTLNIKKNVNTMHIAKYSVLVDINKHWTSYIRYFSC